MAPPKSAVRGIRPHTGPPRSSVRSVRQAPPSQPVRPIAGFGLADTMEPHSTSVLSLPELLSFNTDYPTDTMGPFSTSDQFVPLILNPEESADDVWAEMVFERVLKLMSNWDLVGQSDFPSQLCILPTHSRSADQVVNFAKFRKWHLYNRFRDEVAEALRRMGTYSSYSETIIAPLRSVIQKYVNERGFSPLITELAFWDFAMPVQRKDGPKYSTSNNPHSHSQSLTRVIRVLLDGVQYPTESFPPSFGYGSAIQIADPFRDGRRGTMRIHKTFFKILSTLLPKDSNGFKLVILAENLGYNACIDMTDRPSDNCKKQQILVIELQLMKLQQQIINIDSQIIWRPISGNDINFPKQKNAHINSDVEAKKLESLKDWLSGLDFIAEQRYIFEKRASNTGLWFFEHEKVRDWIVGIRKRLWIQGGPGVGKSVLASLVYNLLRNADLPVLVIIFDSHKKINSERVLIGALLRQLAELSANASQLEFIEHLFDHHPDQQTQPSLEELVTTLRNSLRLYPNWSIVIDADEEGPEILISLLKLLNDCSEDSAGTFVTSRPCSRHPLLEYFEKSDQLIIASDEQDLRLYVKERITSNPLLRMFFKEPEGMISTAVATANNTFITIKLLMDALSTTSTAREFHQVLHGVPKGTGLDDIELTLPQKSDIVDSSRLTFRPLAIPNDCHIVTALEEYPPITHPSAHHYLLAACDARQHLRDNEMSIRKKLSEYGLDSGYCVQAGFDEVVLSCGLGLLQMMGVEVNRSIDKIRAQALCKELGKLFSPYPGVLTTSTGLSYATPVFNDSGEICELDDVIRVRAKSFSCHNLSMGGPRFALSDVVVSCVHNTASISEDIRTAGTQMECGDEEAGQGDQESGGDQARQSNRDESNSVESDSGMQVDDPSTPVTEIASNASSQLSVHGLHDQSSDPEPSDSNESIDPFVKISWDISGLLYSSGSDPSKGHAHSQTLSMIGSLHYTTKEGTMNGPVSSAIDFKRLVFQSESETVDPPHYGQHLAQVKVDSHWRNTCIALRTPCSTPDSDDKTTNTIAKSGSASFSFAAAFNWLTPSVTGTTTALVSRTDTKQLVRFHSGIVARESRGCASWRFHIDDQKVRTEGLQIETGDHRLPRVEFEFHDLETPQPPEMVVQMESLWRSESTARHENFPYRNLLNRLDITIPHCRSGSAIHHTEDIQVTSKQSTPIPKSLEYKFKNKVPVKFNSTIVSVSEQSLKKLCSG